MGELISVGPRPSRRAIRILCAAVVFAQLLAMPFSYLPWFFLMSTLGSPIFLPIWIVCGCLILLFQGLSSMAATLAVRRFARDARSFSGWHVARWAVLGLLGGLGLAAVIVVCDGLIGYPARVSGLAPDAGYRQTLVGCLALLALPTGVVVGTARGARCQAAL
jgi:hypothetical protein